MMGEAFLGFGAFNTKKITGTDIDRLHQVPPAHRRGGLDGRKAFEQTLGKPQK